MEAVVEIRDLTKTYKLGQTKVRALRGVSLAVQRGEFVAIMGPSGSGKSTLMNLVGCLDRPTSGEYRLTGKTVSKMPADELADIRNQQIGFVFQGFNLLTRATALKNVVLPLMYAGLSGQEQLRRARKMLQLVGLGARMNHKPAELSGGQQQRVAIARALVNNPALLLADEPTGNLDSRTSLEVMVVLQALNQRGLTILLVTHDADIAAFTKRQVVFRDGRIVRDEVVAAPRLAEVDWLATRQSTRIQHVAHVQADSARESEAESQ
ncbi:MAG TPA: macrolide ABC transporter ATP-binding protein [Ktedonobacter sp.]|nr:macrolide ABC transporter ATP-binding protein [Ktedonobacter sp.]